MANGDTFFVGVSQPPKNQATSATLLVHTGDPFGTQHTAFWVQRLGSPVCNAAVRGDNFCTSQPGVAKAGVLGMTLKDGIGVLGSVSGPVNVFSGDTGVMGIATSYGVVGRALGSLAQDEEGKFLSGAGVVGECSDGIGVRGSATTGFGVIGESNDKAGVTGASINGVGVEARSDQSHGLQAIAQSGDGVFASSDQAFGVEGIARLGRAGVRGQSDRTTGVVGESEHAVGVNGKSKHGHGVVGESDDAGGVVGISPANAVQGWSNGTGGNSIGVTGWSSAGAGVQGDSDTGIGVCGRSPKGLAAYFQGNVVIDGSFSVVGGTKSAAVRHPDGTQRLLFALESPESYFEDFGEVALTGESIVVPLDKDFAALVKRNKYQVFLTSYGPEALYVRKRGTESFEIARVPGGKGGKLRKVQVGYRIVARRADLKPARLPKTKIAPPITRVTEPSLPSITGKRSRAKAQSLAAVSALPQLDRLPSSPKTPSPDLAALVEAKPVGRTGNGPG
jgi:hypothetical protein